MTRTEFEEITGWCEFIDFCNDNGFEDTIEDIIDDDEYDSRVEDDISEYLCWHSWIELSRALDDLPTGYDYYRCDGTLDYVGLDYVDLESYKDDMLIALDDSDFFDPEEEEEEEEIIRCDEDPDFDIEEIDIFEEYDFRSDYDEAAENNRKRIMQEKEEQEELYKTFEIEKDAAYARAEELARQNESIFAAFISESMMI